MRKGSIYKIECIVTNKVYIGQTVLYPPMKRWVEHCQNNDEKSCISKAIKKFGFENFTFQILKTNIDLNNLNDEEIKYIEIYDSYKNGYNSTLGGHQTFNGSKITELDAIKIIEYIKSYKDLSFVEIAKTLNVPYGCVSDINCGETWYQINETYPIRDNKRNKIEDNIDSIYELLRNGVSSIEIAKIYNVSNVTICNVNNGTIYRNESVEYPIFKPQNSSKRHSIEIVSKIIDMLINTDKNYSEIAKCLNVGRKTVANINNGSGYKELSNELGYISFPLR
ncbi:GIY-YIG nuclease family protein [Escherichia coli O157]|nr:GIY-YIG nuclease family protein [Escherichia coli O157]